MKLSRSEKPLVNYQIKSLQNLDYLVPGSVAGENADI